MLSFCRDEYGKQGFTIAGSWEAITGPGSLYVDFYFKLPMQRVAFEKKFKKYILKKGITIEEMIVANEIKIKELTKKLNI